MPLHGHGLATEVADLQAVLEATEAHSVFSLSAGAVVALATARATPSVAKLALYEPPLSFDGVSQYERELKAGDLAAALVTVLKGTADRTAIRYVPGFLLVGVCRYMGCVASTRPPAIATWAATPPVPLHELRHLP